MTTVIVAHQLINDWLF